MAYHEPEKNPSYPVLSVAIPSAPVRFHVEDTAYAQPVPAAQPVHAYPQHGSQLPMAEPVAVPFAHAEVQPPFAEPVQPGVYVPPPMSLEELNLLLTRDVHFSSKKYFREAKVFFRYNCCKLMTATLMWGLIFMSLGCAINRIYPHERFTMEYPQGPHWGWERPIDTPMPTEPYPANPTGGDAFEPVDTPAQPTEPIAPYGNDNMDSAPAPVPEISSSMARPAKCKFFMKILAASAACLFLFMPAFASFWVAVFNAMRLNGPIRFRDFFSCFCCRYFCRLIPLSIALGVLRVLLSFLILPGIWFSIASIFAVPLHREHKFLGTCKSISFSIKVVHRHFCSMIGFLILIGLLQVVGLFLFGVGLLFTIPFGFVAMCYCYADLIGINEMPMLVAQPVVV